ncbi:endonuclease domain-containing protein [Jiella sp. M17.18]|uniref:endonuclease domain-containing protein n=1 Tax=Jiella sp. M17.18 TaxID=3234247 RepID=UPI0034DE0F94
MTDHVYAEPGADADTASPSPETGEGAPKGRMRASRAAPAYLTARARGMRYDPTDAEARLWSDLRGSRLNGYRFVRQLPIKPYIVDFACRSHRLVVEVDGFQHADDRSDPGRTASLNDRGWSVLRFWNAEVLRERAAVCETILAVLDGRIGKRCDGGGWSHGLRFAPGRPSPASRRSAPSPAGGRGGVPLPTAPGTQP